MAGTTYTFTNAGATGREGPTQSQINTNYSGTNLANSVTINTQGIQEWTVPADGNYSIEAWGASGGKSDSFQHFGKGAKIAGNFALSQGTVLKILVGQESSGANLQTGGGAGGGGSFVTLNNSTPLIVAGGGGGGGYYSTTSSIIDAITSNHGADYVAQGRHDAGGAGGSFSAHKSGQEHGRSFLSGGQGGNGNYLDGGFGGGGGHDGGNNYAAGGGGYSGGSETSGSAVYQGNQGGGGSYNSGIDQNNTAGANTGHGRVVIKYLGSSASPLDIGLVAWYPLDGNGTDHSVTANHGTVHGATPTADRHGVAEKALLFDGSNDYLEAAFNQTVSSSAFTYSVWAKPTSTTTHHGSVITSRDSGQGFLLYKMPDNTWDFWVSKNSGWLKVPGQAITFNWTAFALSYDGSTYNFFKNGSLLSSATGTYQPNTSKPLRIGAGRTESTANYFFKGALDEVRIWNRGLSTSEITSLYSMEKPANNPPTELNSTAALAFSENQPAGTVVGEFNATDSDSGSSLSYHLVSGTGDGNNALFILDANGTLKTLHSFDYETNTTSHSIRLRVTDEHNASLEGNFTIALLNQIEDLDGDGIEDHYDADDDGDGFPDATEIGYGSNPRDPHSVANAAPAALILNDSNFSENQPAGTIVGEFNATDPDANPTLSFSLLSGANLFSLDANGTLRTLHVLDFETNATSYAISVRVTDEHNASLEGNFTISLLNQVEDLDGDGTEDHYDSDDDGDGFPDATEIGYGSDPRDSNSVANAAPSSLELNGTSILENQPVGTIIGYISATDPDAKATLSFSLVDGNTSGISLDTNGTLRALVSLDYETQPHSHLVRIRVTDEHNASLEGNFTIALLDDPSDNQSPENNATGASNPDGNQTTVDQNATASAWWEADADSGNGWRASPWLGSFRPYSNGWIYHLGLGWAYAQPDELDGLWLWMPNEQWVWSAPHCWPHMWKHSSSNWLYFVKEHEGKPALYDYSTESFRWK